MSDNALMMKKRIVIANDADTSGTGVVLNYYAATKVDVLRWGLAAVSALDVGSFAAELNVHQPGGTTDVIVDTMSTTTDRAIGVVLYKDLVLPVAQTVGEDNLSQAAGYGGRPSMVSLLDVAPAGPLQLNPGDSIEIEITTGMTSGAANWFVEIVEHDHDAGASYSVKL